MNQKLLTTLKILGIPVIYGVILRLFFDVDQWDELFYVMSLSFLFCLPTIMGVLTIYFSPIEKVNSGTYKFFMPWVPIGFFMFITLIAQIEGWACWLMVAPLFLLAASLGGFIGGWLKTKKSQNRLNISLIALAPFLLAPAESLINTIPSTYKAYTEIDIKASKEEIWKNVTRVKEIDQKDDSGWLSGFLGFPRPIKAELDYDGIGAYRKAIFTGGLIFHETVYEYHHEENMSFTIKANPHEIPSTTMDEHILIGGDYFDVLNGTYELEKLDNETYRLHLYSHFQMNTHFNFYAGYWGQLIMKDIQNNILRVIKKRAEK
ncbi:hypothetical protein C9994_03005 [Marivirga lumbricoides]|uniref:SRPBCC family protein n=1 Tax=Marivirga lumbricoides TaxID=1046115 RepID=A0A2T4DUD5_9BACT|nr:hypothetical protein C9994_03005 [Marivirga lumbricoides]